MHKHCSVSKSDCPLRGFPSHSLLALPKTASRLRSVCCIPVHAHPLGAVAAQYLVAVFKGHLCSVVRPFNIRSVWTQQEESTFFWINLVNLVTLSFCQMALTIYKLLSTKDFFLISPNACKIATIILIFEKSKLRPAWDCMCGSKPRACHWPCGDPPRPPRG